MSDTIPPLSNDKILFSSASSNVQKLAAAIAHAVYDDHKAVVRAIGAGSVNQAVKAIAIARGFVAPRGFDLICVPSFQTIPGKDSDISATVLTVTPR